MDKNKWFHPSEKRVKGIAALLLCLWVSGCGITGRQFRHPGQTENLSSVKVLTINLMGPMLYIHGREHVALQLMRQYDADIICFQEGIWGPASLFFTKGHWNSATKIASRLGMTYAFEKCWNDAYLCWFTVGILSRWNIEEVRRLQFPGGERDGLKASVIGRLGDIAVVSAHLSYNHPGAQLEQMTGIVENMMGTPYVIIAGDMNTEGDDIADYLAARGYKEVILPGPTFGDPDNPMGARKDPKKIDRIFIKGFEVVSTEIVFTPPNHISDHYGVLAVLSRISQPDR